MSSVQPSLPQHHEQIHARTQCLFSVAIYQATCGDLSLMGVLTISLVLGGLTLS